ncbi:hypothetical protein Ctha_1419 [Chloroherpeton thalassium ATCC 35110]|uniref:Uncharacterized protein n=1 Tax=Chloroherpeton thalassium (strain ATCC 35110 / GB-78) TaxID=517418 RepID=B3QRS9_CHLT3|nr:heavy metal-binding domain-containing protein [Chloroherpeton thalassium]ACF13882.1 hypothetical protein Ctha_1419 [Chloroherpeton thalassium ATCC 35110]
MIVTTADLKDDYDVIGPVYFQLSNKGFFSSKYSQLEEYYEYELLKYKEQGQIDKKRQVDWSRFGYAFVFGTLEVSPGHGLFDRAFFISVEELKKRAQLLGADAIIGMRQDIDIDSQGFQFFYLQMYGTAVKLKPKTTEIATTVNDELSEFKEAIEKKRKFEEAAQIIYEGLTSVEQLVQVLDNKIEQDREFYEYLVLYPKFNESEEFLRIVKEHESGYADRKKQREEMARQKAAEEAAQKIEEAKRKEREDFLKRVEEGKNTLAKLEQILQEITTTIEQARLEEEAQMRKRFGKDLSEALVLYRKAQINSEDAERMSLKALDVFKQAIDDNLEFDRSLLKQAERLAVDARKNYTLAKDKLSDLRKS